MPELSSAAWRRGGLELAREVVTSYRKINHDPAAIEALFMDVFLDAHARAPKEIVLELTPPHRFFHVNDDAPAICRCTCSEATASGKAQALEHRRQRRRSGRDRADRRTYSRALAERALRSLRRFRLPSRGAEGPVRADPGRFCVRP